MRGLELRLSQLASDLKDKAAVRAINKVADQAKVAASRKIRGAGYNLKASDLKSQIRVIRATTSNMVAIVRASGRPIPLIRFGARQTKKGVSVKVKDGRKVIKGAFIATMPTGHVGVFENLRSEKHHKMGYYRIQFKDGRRIMKGLQRSQGKMEELFGPSIPRAFANKVVQGELKKLVRARFPAILKHEAKFIASRGR